MANEKRPPGSQGTRRRRPPAVIDLPATEVVPDTAPPPAAEAAAPHPELFAKPDEAAVPPSPVVPAATAAEQAGFEPPPPPPNDPPRVEREPESPRRPSFAFVPDELSWSHATTGLAGAAGGLLVALLFWLFGAFSGGADPSADLNPRLAAIEKQLKDIAARPMPASVDPKAIDDIAARLAKIESAQSAPRAPVTDPVVLGRIAATENGSKSLADNMAGLSRRADAIDAALRETNGRLEKLAAVEGATRSLADNMAGLSRRADAIDAALRETGGRIDKLTATLGEVQSTARAAAAGSDRASRLAVATSALRNAVERGDAFAAELAIVKPLAPDAGSIAALEPFAASGVPGNAALGQELAALVRPMLRATDETPPREGNFLDRLQANAKQLVRVRPAEEEARGDDRAAVLSRVEHRAVQGNIGGAVVEIAKLPADAKAVLQPWTAKAEARNRALDASRRLAADAVAALKAAP